MRHFYVAIVEKMVKTFPFHDTASAEISLCVESRLQVVRHTESNDGEEFGHSFQDYQLSPDDDLPAVKSDSRVDTFWAEMDRKKIFHCSHA